MRNIQFRLAENTRFRLLDMNANEASVEDFTNASEAIVEETTNASEAPVVGWETPLCDIVIEGTVLKENWMWVPDAEIG